MRKGERFVPAVVRIVDMHAYRPADDDRNGKSYNNPTQCESTGAGKSPLPDKSLLTND